MKSLRFVLLIAAMVLTVTSCDWDDDGYSLSNIWIGFGVAEDVDEDGNSFIIRMDDGSVLYPTVNHAPWFQVEDNQRLLVNFTILGDKNVSGDNEEYFVRINSLKEILYKGIFDITPETEDSIGNDPVHVADEWQVRNMLSFELQYYGSSETHYINLVKEPGTLTSADEPVQLELRHNNRNDEPYIQMTAYVTFDMESLRISGQDSVRYTVTGVDFNDETYTYNGVYKYENN